MAWLVFARTLLAAAVVYLAVLLHPISADPLINGAFGAAVAALIVFVESRGLGMSVTHLLGALIGGVIGLALARIIGTR